MSKLRKVKVGPAVREFLATDKRQSKAASTQYSYRRCLDVLLTITGSQLNTQELRAKHINQAIGELRKVRTEVSLNTDRSILRTFVTWLQDNQMLSPYQKPCSDLELVDSSGKARVDQILTPEEIPACFMAAGERHPSDRAAFALGLYACMRESEILDLKWATVDFDNARLEFFRRKPDDWHEVPIAPALLAELQQYRLWMVNKFGGLDPTWYVIPRRARSAGGTALGQKMNHNVPIYPDQPRAELARMCHEVFKVAGRDQARWGIHTLRRTGACLWYEHTKDIRVVQGILGHSQVKTTERYIQYRDGMTRLMSAAAGFDPLGVGTMVTPLAQATVTQSDESSNVVSIFSRKAG